MQSCLRPHYLSHLNFEKSGTKKKAAHPCKLTQQKPLKNYFVGRLPSFSDGIFSGAFVVKLQGAVIFNHSLPTIIVRIPCCSTSGRL